MPDLSKKDAFYVMPLLIGGTMWLQQKLSTTPNMDPSQAKMMLWMMPIMMTVMFISLPAGVGLYFIASNAISIAQQRIVNKLAPLPASSPAAKKS